MKPLKQKTLSSLFVNMYNTLLNFHAMMTSFCNGFNILIAHYVLKLATIAFDIDLDCPNVVYN